MTGEPAHRIELIDVSKSFPGVLANDQVSLQVRPGEIHALLGENGAGKSTLVKMIYGILSPDKGGMNWNGQPITIANPKAARQLGIGMVFQHFSLFEAMSVLENIELGLDTHLSRTQLEIQVREVLKLYDLNLDPHRTVSTLSVGERQRIEIVRALLLQPKLLIMDEPTSVLTPQEVEQLFSTLRQLAATGCSILYISHKLQEVRDLCEAATILRGGKVVAQCDPRELSPRAMAELMIGSNLKQVQKNTGSGFGDVRFEVAGLTLQGDGNFAVALNDISFAVRAGEIFGIAGVAGNGQSELSLALSGERVADNASSIMIDAVPVGLTGVMGRRAAGMCIVPEERNGHAAVPEFSLADNAVLTARDRMKLMNGVVIDSRASTAFAERIISTFAVKASGPEALASSLSGGNLQKFIAGREIMQEPVVLVISQPTWGVDAGAAAAIHQALVDLAAKQACVLVISQDLDELLSICDRLAVMNEGRLSPALDVGEASIDQIGLLMGGVHGQEKPHAH